MRLQIIGKNIEVWDKTKEKIEKKMGRIEKLFPEDSKATITLSVEKITSTIEATVVLNKRVLRAEVQEDDIAVAMDKVVDILERQVVRYKKRIRSKVRHDAQAFQAEYNSIAIDESSLDDEEHVYQIERVKQFDVKPMDPEEAVLEMELLGHNFFVFRNSENEQINVVYKRKGNTYGLIEPEM